MEKEKVFGFIEIEEEGDGVNNMFICSHCKKQLYDFEKEYEFLEQKYKYNYDGNNDECINCLDILEEFIDYKRNGNVYRGENMYYYTNKNDTINFNIKREYIEDAIFNRKLNEDFIKELENEERIKTIKMTERENNTRQYDLKKKSLKRIKIKNDYVNLNYKENKDKQLILYKPVIFDINYFSKKRKEYDKRNQDKIINDIINKINKYYSLNNSKNIYNYKYTENRAKMNLWSKLLEQKYSMNIEEYKLFVKEETTEKINITRFETVSKIYTKILNNGILNNSKYVFLPYTFKDINKDYIDILIDKLTRLPFLNSHLCFNFNV